MADITIPGVSDKYKSQDLIQGLMKAERVPLEREKSSLESAKSQQDSWRDINVKMSSLRESAKALYSFDNPFAVKLVSVSQEDAISATANRNADLGEHKVEVIKLATSDRFLSKELDAATEVPKGTYTYVIDRKTVSLNWKGGKIADFVTALNKRGGDNLKASLIGVGNGGNKKALLIEATKTGGKNQIAFKGDALKFAVDTQMLGEVEDDAIKLDIKMDELTPPTPLNSETLQIGMPEVAIDSVTGEDGTFTLLPRTGFSMAVPEEVTKDAGNALVFNIKPSGVDDVTISINEGQMSPQLPISGGVDFQGVTISNAPSSDALPEINPVLPEELRVIDESSVVYVKSEDDTIVNVPIDKFLKEDGSYRVFINMKDFKGIKCVEVHNVNTGKTLFVSDIAYFKPSVNGNLGPLNPITKAGDAVLKYEGIRLSRDTNDIDDVIPNVTLNLKGTTEGQAALNITPDKDGAKDALINFVGKYNQLVAQINILTQNKPELISELDYLSSDEKKQMEEKLALFIGDTSLNNGKVLMQRILSSVYKYNADAKITMLSQIGISTRATAGGGTGYNPSQMRGYLEVDEKKLDDALLTQMEEVKNLFGSDTDNDLIIDKGIAIEFDKQLTSWVQSGGLIANKNSTLDKQIKASEKKIATLEDQLAKKESDLKKKYGVMEGALNSLQSQSNTISNFANQNSNNNK